MGDSETVTDALLEAPLLIGGRREAPGEWFDSENPADEQVIGRAALAGPADVARAVDAADAARRAWAATGARGRADVLRSFAEAVVARSETLLAVEVADTGNTTARMARDVVMGVDLLTYYAGLALELKGETVPSTPQNLHLTVREPFGVVGRIVPFNHPVYFALSRIAAPLVAGNTVVLKAPEQCPLSAGILADAAIECLPPGVLNIVNGPGHVTGDALVRDPRVRRIGFTGSVPTGQAIQRSAAESGIKSVSLELGGKNPMILCPDVDVDVAVEAAISGMNFSWQGQSCGSTSRLLVHDSLYDEVLAGVAARARGLRVGDPQDPATEMGPLNSRVHYERVLGHIAEAREDGAVFHAGGARPRGARFERGYWLEPTVVAVEPHMRLAQREVFGPVLSVLRWSTLDEVVAIANATEYGLTASIWTHDLDVALHLAREVHAGYVWVNGSSTHFPGMPFGGVKSSGIGRDESREELESYTEVKSINVLLSSPRLPTP
jgi:betaine-aldehyde dehydrogenase